jgi:large subunit ribosomal protein L24
MGKKLHVKKGERVEVIAGNHRGSSGNVLEICGDGQRVRIEGVNVVKKHARKTQANPQGGVVEQEAPIHISNVRAAAASE